MPPSLLSKANPLRHPKYNELADVIASLPRNQWLDNTTWEEELHVVDEEIVMQDIPIPAYPNAYNECYCPIAWSLKQGGVPDHILENMSMHEALREMIHIYGIDASDVGEIADINSYEEHVELARNRIIHYLRNKNAKKQQSKAR